MPYHCIIQEGNLLEAAGADFIVNASNTLLQLGSGISEAFRRHCGASLQTEMLQKLRALGHSLEQGDVVATSAGNATNFRYALHAAVMDYNPGVSGRAVLPTLQTIETVLENIEAHLRAYVEIHGMPVTLALPLMGTGVGGLAKTDVADLYDRFFRRKIPFECLVIIYGHGRSNGDLLRARFERA